MVILHRNIGHESKTQVVIHWNTLHAYSNTVFLVLVFFLVFLVYRGQILKKTRWRIEREKRELKNAEESLQFDAAKSAKLATFYVYN